MHEDPAGSEAARWYRGRLVTGPFAPFDLAGLALLEAGTGLPLPAAYRAFLEVGGGRLEYAVHLPAWAPEPLQSFNRLYRPGRDEHGEHGWGTLLGEYRRGEELWHEVFGHPGLLPRARNDGGDLLLIDLSPGEGGRLHAAVHGIPPAGYVTDTVRTEVAAVTTPCHGDGLARTDTGTGPFPQAASVTFSSSTTTAPPVVSTRRRKVPVVSSVWSSGRRRLPLASVVRVSSRVRRSSAGSSPGVRK